MKKKLERINNALLDYFGVPVKASIPPDALDLLIATILSQNTNDKNSYRAFLNLKENYPVWDDVLKLNIKKLEGIIKIAGLASQKAAAIKSLLNYLKKEKDSVTLKYADSAGDDEILSELTSIKGIGIKTASCVLLFSLERNVCPVDTHVHRILNRVGLVQTSSPEKTFKLIKNNIPQGTAHQIHTNLIRLGREICKPSVPACSLCPLKKLCKYPSKDFSRKLKYGGNDFFLLDNVKTS